MTDNHIDAPRALVWAGATDLDIYAPDPAGLDIAVMARGLSRLARYRGLNDGLVVSVAAHSLLCGDIARARGLHLVLPALLHDAAEAYLGDMTRPLKAQLPSFSAIEGIWQRAICDWAGLPRDALDAPAIRWVDNMALAAECHVAHRAALDRWTGLPAPDADVIERARHYIALPPDEAAEAWATRTRLARMAFGKRRAA